MRMPRGFLIQFNIWSCANFLFMCWGSGEYTITGHEDKSLKGRQNGHNWTVEGVCPGQWEGHWVSRMSWAVLHCQRHSWWQEGGCASYCHWKEDICLAEPSSFTYKATRETFAELSKTQKDHYQPKPLVIIEQNRFGNRILEKRSQSILLSYIGWQHTANSRHFA